MKFCEPYFCLTHSLPPCEDFAIKSLLAALQWNKTSRMLIYLLLLYMTLQLDTTDGQNLVNSGWPIRVVPGARELTHCEGLGYPNASKNECGYCTGGKTGLFPTHGRDCKGKCDGPGVVDCAGVCGGTAYTDECSGLCVGGTTSIKSTAGNSNRYRDCRGYCLVSGGQFFNDSCGVCHSGTSPFVDCTNKCHLPGQEHTMAKLLCGRCVGGSSGVSEFEVLDACLKCKSEGLECICNGTGMIDPCGVCSGGGKTCMRVLSFFPHAAPNQTDFDIFVKGAFRGRSQNLRCLLTQVTHNEELGRQLKFPGNSNGTHLRCRIKLGFGVYRVGASIEVGETPEVDNVEDVQLLIYESADYSDMTPIKAVFDRDSNKELIITFTGGRVPPRALICIVTGQGWPSEYRLAHGESNSLDTCTIPYANTSIQLTISPSLNGIHPFNKRFILTFYASPPEMRKYYIAEDGHAVVIVFDRPVNLCGLDNCSAMLNTDTIARLGGNATCTWATKQQLVITVQRAITGDPIRITFKRGILKQGDQQYTLAKYDYLTIDAWYPQPSSSAQLTISGPSTIPVCGNFTLVGHFSSPKGDAEFYWTANRQDQLRLESNIANALLGYRSASLSLDSALLQVGMNYTFILTAEHPGNEKYEARHVVERKSYVGPVISAYSDIMAQLSVGVSQLVTLQADISIPECVTEMELVQILWTVDNPRVKFDFHSRSSQVYKILPYTLPENTVVTFSAIAYFINLSNTTSSSITLRVEPLMLKAAIKGSSKRVVGNQDGVLVLESEDVNGNVPLVYQWRCHDKIRGICYNYNPNATTALLITRELQRKPKLEIPLKNLKAGHTFTFELQVFNANNRYQSSTAASTVVVVENGGIPQVVIQSVIADGILPYERHPTTGAYSVPARLPVVIHATITSPKDAKIKHVSWDVKGFSSPFTYSTMNGNTYLTLEEDFLVDHGIYIIGVSACTERDMCGVANLTVHAVAGVTLCQLITNPYVEYEMIEMKVKGCSVPIGRQPLTYQLFLELNGSVIPLTPPQTSLIFNLFGPPVPSNVSQFYIQVCDKVNLCKLFPGNPVIVSQSEVKDEDRLKLFDKAEKLTKTNNAMAAMSLFLTAAIDSKISLSTDEADAMLAAATKAVVNRYISPGDLALVYSAMLPLLRNDDKNVKLKALAIMRRATIQAYAYEAKPPTNVLALGQGNTIEALPFKQSDPDIPKRIYQTHNTIIELVGRSMPLGSRKLLEVPNVNHPTTLIYRGILDKNSLRIKVKAADKRTEGIVIFEEDIIERFKKWKCAKLQDCEGSVVALTLYPGLAPYPSEKPRVSPVLDVTLRNPSTGRARSESFSDPAKALHFTITQYGNYTKAKESGTAFKCFYYDEKEREWTREGITTMGAQGNTITCWSSHLGAFGIFEVYEGLSTASIVGIVVAVLMGVFIFGMLVFFFLRKKQASAMRVSTEALQPKHNGKSMEQSIASVKN